MFLFFNFIYNFSFTVVYSSVSQKIRFNIPVHRLTWFEPWAVVSFWFKIEAGPSWSANLNHTRVYLTEQFHEATMTIGFVVLLFKSTLIELFQTESANEMFGMKFSVHRSYTSPCRWKGKELRICWWNFSPEIRRHECIWVKYMKF